MYMYMYMCVLFHLGLTNLVHVHFAIISLFHFLSPSLPVISLLPSPPLSFLLTFLQSPSLFSFLPPSLPPLSLSSILSPPPLSLRPLSPYVMW